VCVQSSYHLLFKLQFDPFNPLENFNHLRWKDVSRTSRCFCYRNASDVLRTSSDDCLRKKNDVRGTSTVDEILYRDTVSAYASSCKVNSIDPRPATVNFFAPQVINIAFTREISR
jgi:hypothetical protein